MIERRRPKSRALNMLDNRIKMSKSAEFAREKIRQLEERKIKIDWLRPKDQVIEQLTAELPKIGVNKWVADQAAKEIYEKAELGLGGKNTLKVSVTSRGMGLPTKGQQKRAAEKQLSPAAKERMDKQKFLRTKNRLGPVVAREMENSLYKLNMREEEFIQLVKLTWSFRDWTKRSNPHEVETMALEIARDIKRREMWKRNLYERIRAP